MNLMLAEACYMLGDQTGAWDYLHKVQSVRMPDLPAYTDVLTEIKNERRREFLGESYCRWKDMKRYGILMKKPVKSKSKYANPGGEGVQEKIIPVIFHVFQYTGTENTEFVIGEIHLADRIRKLNNAYSRLISAAAAATDTKIRFELTEHTSLGRPLMVAGMNRSEFGAEELKPEDFGEFYRDEQFDWPAFLKFYGVDWDPGRFLNVWILPTGAVKIPSYRPAVIQAGKTSLKGLEMDEMTQNITVTNEQAARMHYVLENVPTRKMWKVVK